MSRVRLILVALLFCWSIRVDAESSDKPRCSGKPKKANLSETSTNGHVKLTSYPDKRSISSKDDDQCVMLTCEGSASPHKRVVWYRLSNSSDNSSGLPIAGYWSERYYYEITRSATSKDQISSTLIIQKFNSGYVGEYYCVLYNGEISIRSPTSDLKLLEPYAGEGKDPDTTDTPELESPVEIHNITAIRITNTTSVRITWNRVQRKKEADKFCRIWRKDKKDKKIESYRWILQVLEWDDLTDYETIKTVDMMKFNDYNSANEHIDNQTLNRPVCRDQAYVLTNISLSSYYKFQIIVEKYSGDKLEKYIARNGSYIHYFGKQSPPKIVDPGSYALVCRPRSDNPCKAIGSPPPRVQLLQEPLTENKYQFLCIATNTIIDNFGVHADHTDLVDFLWNTPSCPTPPAPSPLPPRCVDIQSHDSVCSEHIGTKIYVAGGENITVLEKRAEAAINNLYKDGTTCYEQLVKFICYSYLPPCYLGTPEFKPRSVCPQSCDYIQQKCKLPSGLNCSNLVQTEAGSPSECIHLSAPVVEEEVHTDGSCVVGKGTSYNGNDNTSKCMEWDDERQVYYNTAVFTELKSAGSSCRNPGGSGERPWCYTDFASPTSSTRWKYCDIPKCPSCEHVPDVCRAVYKRNTTVHVTGNSYPVEDLSRDCFPNTQDRCYEVWRTVVCHLAYPECIEAQESNEIHGSRPLCKSYCNEIKNITSNCGFPSECDQSLFIHSINCAGLPDRDCISADLNLEIQKDDQLVNPGDSTEQGSNHQLAISIYVAAAVCLFSVFTIIGIIIGYCCCLYTHEGSSEPKVVKPIENPFDHPVFANMNMRSIENPDYTKLPSEKDSTLGFKSLRPISKSKIRYIRDLGSGNFGLVYQGRVEGILDGEEFTMAAIKTLREGTSAEGMKNFLHEAKLACQFDHENIIKLYGICMSEGFYCLVFEYMDLGDLNEYLRNSASSTQRRIMNPLDNSIRSRTESSLSNSPARLNSQQLVSICHQIALGMQYFASLNHVHRDLATRNCLVSTGLVVKIGDFGMSQTLYHSDYYKQKGEQALPVRWMAPEAFIYGRFSTEGDVWSFGVVMWEVFSFAMQPYYGKMNDQVMNEVRRGHTLARPDDCPESIFEIMRSCWQMEPHRRPSFSDLVEELHSWKPTHGSTSTAMESQGSTKGDMEDSLSLASIQDKDLELSVFEEYDMSGTEEDIAN